MLPGSETSVTPCHCVKQHEGVPEHMDRVVHIIEWLERLMDSVCMEPSSYLPCDSWVCFTVGQALALPHYHGSGTTPSRPLGMFWKARGFNGTGADCFMAVGFSPRQFSWACLFITIDVTAAAMLTWCCAMVDQHAKITQAQQDTGVATLLMWLRDVTQPCFFPKETGLLWFHIHHTQ